ncbi:LysR family transcriptional regulator [Paractinoplanes ferrugineus]|uniref:LysR family transcriptional regulator n=1 Tax=Paractinoplanes ferrugineus TaxID=113564 RepID=A0A919J3V9_9ACTN|nr:LysR family transcriptional regulator [Actinoplanes ferrugineus]GIE13184.1 LysR family transcriptional regulator [Actinoplanes ferrugineus]
MHELDVRRLRVLRELSRCGTVTAAAQALHLTPSAVSQQLAALSREAGVPLIEQAGRRVRLTNAARILLDHADEILARIELAQAEVAASLGGATGEVTLGGFAATLSGLALPALHLLRDSSPGLRLRIVEVEHPEAVDLLLRGDLDVVLTIETQQGPAATDGRFHRRPLLTDVLDVALPADHPQAHAPVVDLAGLAQEPWILPHADACLDVSLATCAAAGFTPHVAHSIGDWEGVMTAVSLGLGVALVSRLAGVATRPGVVVRRLEADRPARHITAVLRRGSQHAPHLAAVLRALSDAARPLAHHEEPLNVLA